MDDATHKIVGTEFQYRKMKKGNEELEAWLSRMLSPRINFRFFEVPMDEGMVVLMEIPCAEKTAGTVRWWGIYKNWNK